MFFLKDHVVNYRQSHHPWKCKVGWFQTSICSPTNHTQDVQGCRGVVYRACRLQHSPLCSMYFWTCHDKKITYSHIFLFSPVCDVASNTGVPIFEFCSIFCSLIGFYLYCLYFQSVTFSLLIVWCILIWFFLIHPRSATLCHSKLPPTSLTFYVFLVHLAASEGRGVYLTALRHVAVS